MALLAAYESSVPAAPVLAVMAMGIVIAIYGHAAHSYRIVGIGLALVFLATLLMLIGAYIAYKRGERDPRPAPDFLGQERTAPAMSAAANERDEISLRRGVVRVVDVRLDGL